MAYHFLGGLMAHARGLTAIAAPCVNSYKRLVSRGSRSGATWAPINIAYGNNNRTAFVRGPGGRLELRVPDASSNPYLLTAAIVHAGLDGIRRKLDPGEPCNDNLYQLSLAELKSRGIARLPASLMESLEALESDKVLCKGLGEAFVAAAQEAVVKKCPYIIFTAAGGARMQEGILSLMQMPRSTVAIQMLRDEGLPYIVVLTDPTTGGVTASYAMLGDIQIAEPGALIGFAGQRVIEQTIREKLPEGFQRAEYLLAHGMIDMVTHRHELKATLSGLIDYLMAGKMAA